jgi:hypothetical protein
MGGEGEIATLIWDEGFPGNSKSGCCINPFPCGDPMNSSPDQARPRFMLFSFRDVFRDSYVLWGISDWLAGFLNQTTQIQPDLGKLKTPKLSTCIHIVRGQYTGADWLLALSLRVGVVCKEKGSPNW